MTLSLFLWVFLAVSVVALVIGTVEWRRRPGNGWLVRTGVGNVCLFVGLLLGAAHPVLKGVMLATVVVLVAYTFVSATRRPSTRWPRPLLVAVVASMLLTTLMTFIPGRSREFDYLAYALWTCLAVMVGYGVWVMVKLTQRYREIRLSGRP